MALVVAADDSPTMRRIVAGVLTKQGHEVVTVADGLAAVQAVFRLQPDVVVLDVQMPRLYGYTAARLLKDDWSTAEIPVVLLTSLGAASDRYWGERNGADRYLTKDFEAPQLADTVAAVLADAEQRRGGRPRLKADPQELSDDDVLERTCEVLDRTLFTTSLVAEITALPSTVVGFEATVGAVLGTVARVVDAGACAVVLPLPEGLRTYVTVGVPVDTGHLSELLARCAATLDVPVTDLMPSLSDPAGLLAEGRAMDPGDVALRSFLSMPLPAAGGRPPALLALSTCDETGFDDAALATLRILAAPIALVLDHARLTSAAVPA
ncbi:MAG: response regulator receiver protein [Mycobacterium sp.]|nr:response regulator receiver protein [Mycobacterium sp.]